MSSTVYGVTATVHYSEQSGMSIDTAMTPSITEEEYEKLNDADRMVALVAGALNGAMMIAAGQIMDAMRNRQDVMPIIEAISMQAAQSGMADVPVAANDV